MNASRLFKLNFLVAFVALVAGCAGSGGGGIALTSPPSLTSALPTVGSATAAPTAAAVVTGAGSVPSAAAGTLTATPAGATAGTQGVAGLAVSFSSAVNNTMNTGKIGEVTIDPAFNLTPTGSIVGGTVTGLTITGANATTGGGRSLAIIIAGATATPLFSGSNTSVVSDTLNTVQSSTATAAVPASAATPGIPAQPAEGAHSEAYMKTNTYIFDPVTKQQVVTPIAAAANNDHEIRVQQEVGYLYTQYGSWYQCSANCNNTSALSAEVDGVFVSGEATLPANIPTTGSFTYSGQAFSGGNDAAGNIYLGHSVMTASANFATRSIAFSTSDTQITSKATSIAVAKPSFDMSGTLTYVAGQNLFAGAVTTAGAGLSGTASGRFNGPAAQEIGGIFSLSGAGGAAAVGSFVGK